MGSCPWRCRVRRHHEEPPQNSPDPSARSHLLAQGDEAVVDDLLRSRGVLRPRCMFRRLRQRLGKYVTRGLWHLMSTCKTVTVGISTVWLPDAERPLDLDDGMQRSPDYCARVKIVAVTHSVPMLW